MHMCWGTRLRNCPLDKSLTHDHRWSCSRDSWCGLSARKTIEDCAEIALIQTPSWPSSTASITGISSGIQQLPSRSSSTMPVISPIRAQQSKSTSTMPSVLGVHLALHRVRTRWACMDNDLWNRRMGQIWILGFGAEKEVMLIRCQRTSTWTHNHRRRIGRECGLASVTMDHYFVQDFLCWRNSNQYTRSFALRTRWLGLNICCSC